MDACAVYACAKSVSITFFTMFTELSLESLLFVNEALPLTQIDLISNFALMACLDARWLA